MPGRFEGMSGAERELFNKIFPEKARNGGGMPLAACSALANEDDRKHVGKMIETLALKNGKAVRPRKNVRRLAADKGYYADAMGNFLKKKGIQPKVP